MSRKPIHPVKRLAEKSTINKKTGCIEIHRGLSKDGYVMVKVGGRYGKKRKASRVVWEHAYGKIPNGICVLHSCDNRKCINLRHLFLGTHVDNMKDMVLKGRAHRAIGEKSGNCKLTSDQVADIRDDSRKQIVIAIDYGVSKSLISMIKNRKHRIYD